MVSSTSSAATRSHAPPECTRPTRAEIQTSFSSKVFGKDYLLLESKVDLLLSDWSFEVDLWDLEFFPPNAFAWAMS